MQQQQPSSPPELLTNTEFARQLRIQPDSLRSAVSRNGGHYCGVTPIRLPNGRTMWPAAEAERLLSAAQSVVGAPKSGRILIDLNRLESSTGHLDPREFGCLHRLILASCVGDDLPAYDDTVLAGRAGVQLADWMNVRPVIEPYFTVDAGRWASILVEDGVVSCFGDAA